MPVNEVPPSTLLPTTPSSSIPAKPPARPDPPLARPRLLLGIAAGVAGVLWALFPGRTLDARLAHQKADAVSLAYVRNLVRARPSESAPRLRLAEIERALGRFAAADSSLAPLLDAEGAAGRHARWQHLAVGLDQMNAARADDPGRQAHARQALARLERLVIADAPQLADTELAHLARVALAFERPCRAAGLYQRLAGRHTVERSRWRREAERWLVAGEGCARSQPGVVTPLRPRSGSRLVRRRPGHVAGRAQRHDGVVAVCTLGRS